MEHRNENTKWNINGIQNGTYNGIQNGTDMDILYGTDMEIQKRKETSEYTVKQKWACKDGAEMEHTSYTQMEQKLITKWSRHGRQKGTDMEYTMEQKCIA